MMTMIPVLMLYTANNKKEVEEAYAAGASCYIRKPSDFDDWIWKKHAGFCD